MEPKKDKYPELMNWFEFMSDKFQQVNEKGLKKFLPEDEIQTMEKTYINNSRYMEFIDEIATQITEIIFLNDTFVAVDIEYSPEKNAKEYYKFTEEAQEFYNERYDELETLMNRTLGVYSDNEMSL